jgi:long-chain acyl-CoA synthetase
MNVEASPRPGRAAAWLSRHVEVALAQVDLTLAQYRLLALLDSAAAVPSALAEHLTLSRPSITAVVDGLVARDLVRRTPDDGDRRRIRHELTGAGRALLTAADDAVETRLGDVLDALDDPGGTACAHKGLAHWAEAMRAFRDRKLARVVP